MLKGFPVKSRLEAAFFVLRNSVNVKLNVSAFLLKSIFTCGSYSSFSLTTDNLGN